MAATYGAMVSHSELKEMDLHFSSVGVTLLSLKAKFYSNMTSFSSIVSFLDLTIFVCLAIQACKQMRLHTDLKSLIHMGFGRLNNRLWVSLNGLIPQATVSLEAIRVILEIKAKTMAGAQSPFHQHHICQLLAIWCFTALPSL